MGGWVAMTGAGHAEGRSSGRRVGRSVAMVGLIFALGMPTAARAEGPYTAGQSGTGAAVWQGPAGASRCTPGGRMVARPERLALGGTVEIELTLTVDCPSDASEADVVLALDRSGSMTGETLAAAVSAARAFLLRLAEPQHRVAVVSFAEDVTIDAELGHGLSRAYQALAWARAEGRTNLAAGLQASREVIEAGSRPGAHRVVVLLTDGRHMIGGDPLAVAQALRSEGVRVFAIGLGSANEALLRDVATTPEDYRQAPSPMDLPGIYDGLVAPITRPAPGDVVIEEVVAAGFDYEAGSAVPPAQVSGSRVTWALGDRPSQPMRVTHRSRPSRVGPQPASELAVAWYDDLDGVRRSFAFSVPTVEVLPPPTATPTEPAPGGCVRLAGTGRTVRFALVPVGYDPRVAEHVAEFRDLADRVARGFVATEPFASNSDRFTVLRADDYRGRDIDPWRCEKVWYNSLLFEAAEACDHTQIIAIVRRSGCAGGSPAGRFSMIGPGHCPDGGCDNEGIAFTALHEIGHTLAGLRHVCGSADLGPMLAAEFLNDGPIYLPSVATGRPPGSTVGDPDQRREVTLPGARPLVGVPVRARPDPAGQSPLPNCGVGFELEASPCTEWRLPAVTRWALPGDPPHGCFAGCDGIETWYRPWSTTTTIMCRDDRLEHGYTPVERRVLYDLLMRGATR